MLKKNQLIIAMIMLVIVLVHKSSLLIAQDYFPLNIGNIWKYKYFETDSIFIYTTQILDTISISDTLYYKYYQYYLEYQYPQSSDNTYLIRKDELGKIILRIYDQEHVWFDFTAEDSTQYEYNPYPWLGETFNYIVKVRKNISVETFLGTYYDCMFFFFDSPHLVDDEERYYFAPEIGIVKHLVAWSSLGILAAAQINGKPILNTFDCKRYPLPDNYKLLQNYPNPFNSSTNISYSVLEPDFVMLKVFDILGKEIQTLVNQSQSIGYYTVYFNAINLPTGIYLYQLQVGNNYSVNKKMLLLR